MLYTPLEHQKTRGFLILSEGELEHRFKMGFVIKTISEGCNCVAIGKI